MRSLRHLIHSAIEGGFVGLRRLAEAAELSNELKRRRADFFVGRRWFEVVQGLNVSTHNAYFAIVYRREQRVPSTKQDTSMEHALRS